MNSLMLATIQSMLREFNVDKGRIYDFHKRFLKHVVKIFLAVIVIFIAILLSSKEGRENIFTITIALLFFLAFILAGVMASTGSETFKAYGKTKIILEEKRMIRMGDGLMTSRINYDDIGRIFHKHYGIVVIKKGVIPFLSYYLSRYPLRLHYDIIFIPYLIEDYSVLQDFFINKKYLDADISL